ncbi:hypothetical protein BSZ39_02640 [Bowdeniella nasicola]|uniref:Flavin reductase like domain-containing protein n=1 Tax=Bowdeniella nasicola TaxID=208480 RepID=A0A1Q5Q4S7_9ACTO|nr:flavin reductase family protein [Bowdeniella nasicola]OKL54702.1 hypothetical protein BSZ39_02640 [Bowdeniella nasicola]
MSELREIFRAIFRRHVAGVSVITFTLEGELGGLTATSVISVAAAPPTIAFAVSRHSGAGQAIKRVERVVVNFLDDGQSELAGRFASRGTPRFDVDSYHLTDAGLPVLQAASGWLAARIVARHEVADSFLVVAEVEKIWVDEDAEVRPLVYLDRHYRELAPITKET